MSNIGRNLTIEGLSRDEALLRIIEMVQLLYLDCADLKDTYENIIMDKDRTIDALLKELQEIKKNSVDNKQIIIQLDSALDSNEVASESNNSFITPNQRPQNDQPPPIKKQKRSHGSHNWDQNRHVENSCYSDYT